MSPAFHKQRQPIMLTARDDNAGHVLNLATMTGAIHKACQT